MFVRRKQLVPKPILTVVLDTATSIYKGFADMANPRTETDLQGTPIKIGTHDGIFHCDEVLACYMLKQLEPYKNAQIIRSRNPDILRTCDIIVDVGGEYNPKTHRYDHHQRQFEETLSSICPTIVKNKFIRLSSVGLVYAHFGLDVIETVLKRQNYAVTHKSKYAIFKYIYETLIEELDAIDNGVPITPHGEQSQYKINTHLSARIAKLNHQWNQPTLTETEANQRFQMAMQYAGDEFAQYVIDAATIWWPAREIVENSFAKRKKYDESGQILVLETYCPWSVHLFDVEKDAEQEEAIKFVIFQKENWRVQGVPVQPNSFVCRVFLHENWRGLRDEQLSKIADIEGCNFCHASGFIGAHFTLNGAIQMALKSIQSPDHNQ